MLFVTGCEDGFVRPHVSVRVVFGGSPFPNRFERVSLLDCAWIQRQQAAFDALHPWPEAAARWQQERAAMQRQGFLPSGAVKRTPSGIKPCIDDLNGRALMDRMPVPMGISLGKEQTAAIGVEPAHDSSRVAVHCRIAMYAERRLG